MSGFFEIIKQYYVKGAVISALVTEGENEGAKALWTKAEGYIFTEGSSVFWRGVAASFDQIEGVSLLEVGSSKVFFEVINGVPNLIICGGGHISLPLADFGKKLDFRVTVIEDRKEMAIPLRFPTADSILAMDFTEALTEVRDDVNNYYVIVTRDPYYDIICLEQILRCPHAYIGMIGNKNRVAKVRKGLTEAGFSRKAIAGIYSPVGLKIGAETPAEISIAILAEIIKVKNAKVGGMGYDEKILALLTEPADSAKPKCLATIVNRLGSMPRQISTKMLVLADGRCIGTIGGGMAEEEIRKTALQVMSQGLPCCVGVDITGKHIKEGEAYTGGVIEVYLEPCL